MPAMNWVGTMLSNRLNLEKVSKTKAMHMILNKLRVHIWGKYGIFKQG